MKGRTEAGGGGGTKAPTLPSDAVNPLVSHRDARAREREVQAWSESFRDDDDDFYIDSNKKYDGRLHPEYPLYCEGLEKPVLRGMLHLVFSLLLPFGTWHLLQEAGDNQVGQLAAVLYTGSNLFCYGTSALYHVGKWSPKVEIMLQKWDHCGIAVLSVGTFVPVSLLLFPAPYNAILLLQLCAICLWTCCHIHSGSSSVLRQILVPASSLLYMPIFFDVLSGLEFGLYFVCVALQLAGVAVFVSQRPLLWKGVCGYHEMFHVFVVAAGISVYLINWSIIRRACDPWVHETNVARIAWEVALGGGRRVGSEGASSYRYR